MTIEAPACGINGCTTPAWGPCDYHQVGAPLPVEHLWDFLLSINPAKFDGVAPHPEPVHRAALMVAQVMVERECARYFGRIDSANPQTRDAQLRHFREQIVESVLPVWYTDESYDEDGLIERMMIREDDFGGAMETGKLLVSYLLRAEWMLARTMGFRVDYLGRPTEVCLPDFLKYHQDAMRRVAHNTFVEAARNYPEYVEKSTGRGPASHFMLAPDLLWTADEYTQHLSNEARRDKRNERLLKVAEIALNEVREFNSPEQREARARSLERREARDARERRERREVRESRERSKSRGVRDEYYGHLNRNHRRKNGWF